MSETIPEWQNVKYLTQSKTNNCPLNIHNLPATYSLVHLVLVLVLKRETTALPEAATSTEVRPQSNGWALGSRSRQKGAVGNVPEVLS